VIWPLYWSCLSSRRGEVWEIEQQIESLFKKLEKEEEEEEEEVGGGEREEEDEEGEEGGGEGGGGGKEEVIWVWWYTPVISTLGRLRQENCEFKASLDYRD
jgi:hypothetical protein